MCTSLTNNRKFVHKSPILSDINSGLAETIGDLRFLSGKYPQFSPVATTLPIYYVYINMACLKMLQNIPMNKNTLINYEQ